MKKKILMLAVAACLIVLSLASSSLAYFTDYKTQENTFTSGKVEITLAYTRVADNTKFFPGQTYGEPATVTVANDSEDAYLGAIIVFTTETAANDDEVDNILTVFGLTDATADTDGNTITVKLVHSGAVRAGNSWNNVLTSATIPPAWGNAEMKIFKNISVSVTAYAVQTEGFDNANAALAAGFNGIW